MGVNKFESISCFADSLIVVTHHSSAFLHTKVVPIDGGLPPFTLPSVVSDYLVSQDSKALVYRTFTPQHDSDLYKMINLN